MIADLLSTVSGYGQVEARVRFYLVNQEFIVAAVSEAQARDWFHENMEPVGEIKEVGLDQPVSLQNEDEISYTQGTLADVAGDFSLEHLPELVTSHD